MGRSYRRDRVARLALVGLTGSGTLRGATYDWGVSPPRAIASSAVLRWLLPLNLGVQILIVVTGGLVRLTGSGLGCSTWPQCEPGAFTPAFRPENATHTFIEFGNRVLGIVVGIVALAVVAAVLIFAAREIRRRMWALAGLVLLGTLGQGVLGGITVLLDLHPGIVMAHFLISMLLIVVSTLLLLTHRRVLPSAASLPPLVQCLGLLTGLVGAVVIVLGTIVTGSGPHSGDAEEPARFGFDPHMVSWLHADSVMLFIGLVVAMVVATALLPDAVGARGPWVAVLVVSLIQGVVGYVQYATGVPVPLVSLHMLGACLLTAALTWGVASVLGKQKISIDQAFAPEAARV